MLNKISMILLKRRKISRKLDFHFKSHKNIYHMWNCVHLSDFKKNLFSKASFLNDQLMPNLNRSLHAHSHSMQIQNQMRNLSKTFGYINQKTLRFWVAEALLNKNYFPLTHLLNNVETQWRILTYKNNFSKSFDY